MKQLITCSILLLWCYCVKSSSSDKCEPACVPPNNICLGYRKVASCVAGQADKNADCGCLWQTYIQKVDDDGVLGTWEGTKCFEWAYSTCEESKTKAKAAEDVKVGKLGDVVKKSQKIRDSISELYNPDAKREATETLYDILNNLGPVETAIPNPSIKTPNKKERATLQDLVALALKQDKLDNPLRTFEILSSDDKANTNKADNGKDSTVYLGEVDKTGSAAHDAESLDTDEEAGPATPGINMRYPTAAPQIILSDEFRLWVLAAVVAFIILAVLVAMMCNCGHSQEDGPIHLAGDLSYDQYGFNPSKNQFEHFVSKLGRNYRNKSLERATKYYERAQDRDLKHNFVRRFNDMDKTMQQRGGMSDVSYDDNYESLAGGTSTASGGTPMTAMSPERPSYVNETAPTPDSQILKTALRQSGGPGRHKGKASADNSLLISMPLNFKKPKRSVIP